MIKKPAITVLIDDKGSRSDLIAEHGLAQWIQADILQTVEIATYFNKKDCA
jgi:hypothetical protein